VADPRDLWIAGQGRRSVEDARRKAAANTAEVMMSQSPEWYTTLSPEGKRENLSRAKDVLQHIPAVTTDPNESRNMYQILMNQMKGGDLGARLIDTSGLPEGARRYGSKLFTDPAKSQGIMGDFGSLFSGRNKAAVRAQEYNPFPKAGFGAEWYKDQFPIASGLGSLMKAAENFVPYFGAAKRMFSKEREPLERDPRYTPVPGSADWESSIFDMMDEPDIVTDLVEGEPKDDLTENFVADEKEEIPFEFNLSELLENIASIPVNPDKAMKHGFEGSATELWTKAKEQAKQAGLDLSGKEVLEMLFRDGWFNPEEIHTMSEADAQSIENQ
jgi:hypothetical protein